MAKQNGKTHTGEILIGISVTILVLLIFFIIYFVHYEVVENRRARILEETNATAVVESITVDPNAAWIANIAD